MGYVTVLPSGEIIAVSSDQPTIEIIEDGIPVGTDWVFANGRAIAPERGGPWQRTSVDQGAADVDVIILSSQTFMPPGINVTYADGVVRTIQTSTGIADVYYGDSITVPAPHVNSQELSAIGVNRDNIFVIKKQESDRIDKK